jgi:RNA polymerase sigma-70 factor (ECF subfamily)
MSVASDPIAASIAIPDSRAVGAIRTPDGTTVPWLERLKRRDRTALAALVKQHGQALTRIAYLQLGDRHAAEDAVQETFLAAWDAARRMRGDAAPRTWLIGILLNRCRKHRRTLSRRRRREQAAACRVPTHQEDASVEQDEVLDSLRNALTQLDDAQRDIIVLRHLQGLSVAETARLLRIPDGTVKSRCHTALSKLRQMLEEVST